MAMFYTRCYVALIIMTPKKIETYGDLPEYGKYVLVSGIDKQMYDVRRWHVCEMNDLEDGLDYRDKGQFFWLTENGTKIEEVTHWCELPPLEQCTTPRNFICFISELKQNWKPKTKTKTGYGYHGSRKGDKIEYTMYFDEYRCEWTTEDRAFQGLVFKNIDKFLK